MAKHRRVAHVSWHALSKLVARITEPSMVVGMQLDLKALVQKHRRETDCDGFEVVDWMVYEGGIQYVYEYEDRPPSKVEVGAPKSPSDAGLCHYCSRPLVGLPIDMLCDKCRREQYESDGSDQDAERLLA